MKFGTDGANQEPWEWSWICMGDFETGEQATRRVERLQREIERIERKPLSRIEWLCCEIAKTPSDTADSNFNFHYRQRLKDELGQLEKPKGGQHSAPGGDIQRIIQAGDARRRQTEELAKMWQKWNADPEKYLTWDEIETTLEFGTTDSAVDKAEKLFRRIWGIA